MSNLIHALDEIRGLTQLDSDDDDIALAALRLIREKVQGALPAIKPNSLPIPDAVLAAVEEQWIGRVQAQAFKPKTKAYENGEREYFIGTMAAIIAMHPEYFMPPRWCLMLMSGRPVIKAERFKA